MSEKAEAPRTWREVKREKGGSVFRPQNFLIKQGEGCPGRFAYRDQRIDIWLSEFEEAEAFPAAFVLADMESRTAAAIIVAKNELRLIEMADTYEGMNRG